MSKMKAIKNHIIFQFLDGFSKQDVKQFAESTDWGFEIVKYNDSVEKSRWGVVIAKGNDVPDEIEVGMEVYIEALKWTEGFTFEDEQYWRTDSEQILAINESEESVGKYVAPDESKRSEYMRNVWM